MRYSLLSLLLGVQTGMYDIEMSCLTDHKIRFYPKMCQWVNSRRHIERYNFWKRKTMAFTLHLRVWRHFDMKWQKETAETYLSSQYFGTLNGHRNKKAVSLKSTYKNLRITPFQAKVCFKEQLIKKKIFLLCSPIVSFIHFVQEIPLN